MDIIANTTDQKFLEAILAELKKTNELLESLCSIAKGAGIPEESKEGTNDGKPHATGKRSANNSKSRSDSPKRGSKRQAVSNSEHGSATALLSPDGDSNSGKRNASPGRKRVSSKANSKR